MNQSAQLKSIGITAVAVSALCAGVWRAEASTYIQTDLVSNIAGLATVTDPGLKNPWGVAHTATSPFWVSNQGTNTSTLYTVMGSTTVTKATCNNNCCDGFGQRGLMVYSIRGEARFTMAQPTPQSIRLLLQVA